MTQTLREAREARSLSQEGLARRAGLAVRTYTRIEAGATDSPAFETVHAICRVLGVGPGEVTEFLRLMQKESVV